MSHPKKGEQVPLTPREVEIDRAKGAAVMRQQARRKAFAALFEEDGSDPTNYDEGEEEDPRPYLSGEKDLGRFVCVTINWSSSGGKLFYLPEFDDFESAKARAEFYDRDDLFEEIPVKVVDLDNGETFYAHPEYVWKIQAPRFIA
jgi:hypothetical protein